MGNIKDRRTTSSTCKTGTPATWGIFRHRHSQLGWIAVVLILIQAVDEKCAVVEGSPVEVEGEFSQLSRDSSPVRSTKRVGIDFLEAARKRGDEMEEQEPMETKDQPSPKIEAVKLILQKFKQIEKAEEREELEEEMERSASESGRTENARAIWVEDYERRAAELCGTKASLECGKRILSLIDGEESDLDVHMKCDLRDDFLKCIDLEKKICLDMAQNAMLPDLPSKDVIKGEQSKLWKVLWTAGGCVLAN